MDQDRGSIEQPQISERELALEAELPKGKLDDYAASNCVDSSQSYIGHDVHEVGMWLRALSVTADGQRKDV